MREMNFFSRKVLVLDLQKTFFILHRNLDREDILYFGKNNVLVIKIQPCQKQLANDFINILWTYS